MYRFSFLLPTRGRPGLVQRFFQSIFDTAHCIEEIEVILCLDDDDLKSQDISDERLSIKKVVFPRGSSMGVLSKACFEASSGRYVILINDDVIIRTKNWDKMISTVFSAFQDDIALIHVNDLLFKESLCTFPILSRRACLETGICPEEYQKYRIDDHIYDIYEMLAYLGHKRIIYLADVLFEHDQYIRSHQTPVSQVFRYGENEIHVSNREIIESDKRIFIEKLGERKQNALKLAYLIDQGIYERRQAVYKTLLNNVRDPYTYRRSNFVKKMKLTQSDLEMDETDTVSVVIPNMRKKQLKKCMSSLKKYSPYSNLIFTNDRYEALNGPSDVQESIMMAFLMRMVGLIQSNQFVLRFVNRIMVTLGKFFNRYYSLPHYVRWVTDGLVFRLVRLYRAIQYNQKN